MSDDTVPADLSLLPVLGIFEDAGWAANHLTRPNGLVKCGACSIESAAGELVIGAMHRLEGASDPEDMQTVLGFECPSCGAGGVLVAGHGPAASEQDDAFLSAVTLNSEEMVDPVAAEPSP